MNEILFEVHTLQTWTLNLCHVSSENVPKQSEQNYVWGLHFFQVIYILDVLKIKKTEKNESNLGELKLLAIRITFLASLSLTWNPLPSNSKPLLPSCKVKPKPVLHKPLLCNQSLDWRGRHERMAEGNLLMKFWLNKPLKFWPNTSQTTTTFDAWVGEMMEHNPTFIIMTNPNPNRS